MSSTWIGILDELASVGLTPADIEKAVASSPEVRARVIEVAEKTRETWKSVWEEMGPHPFETGAYETSFVIEYEDKHDEFSAKVKTTRREAIWLEWGTSKMAERAPAQKTIARMNGELGGATSKKQGGGFTGSVS